MSFVRQVLAWFVGEGWCPSCEGPLSGVEAGHHVCKDCGVLVDFDRGGWRFAGEPRLRRLPGVAGMSYEEDAA